MLESILAAIGASILTTLSSLFLADRKLQREHRLHYQAETIARRLLEDPRWRLRTFKTIKYHLGGFEDNQLRQILVQAGALRFEDVEGTEVWGLLERNRDLLQGEVGTRRN